MTLSFSQQINNEPNYFIEKIWSAAPFVLQYEKIGLYESFRTEYRKMVGKDWDNEYKGVLFSYPPKLHTIRKDEGNRWKAGIAIHPVVNNRTSKRFQFAPEIPCTGVQKIEIKYVDLSSEMAILIKIDDKILSWDEIIMLAINDGFKDVQAFLNYFNTDFKGKIIHWTDLRY